MTRVFLSCGLAHLSKGPPCLRAIVKDNGIAAVLQSLTDLPGEPAVQAAGCGALEALGRDTSTREKIVSSGGPLARDTLDLYLKLYSVFAFSKTKAAAGKKKKRGAYISLRSVTNGENIRE